MLGLRLWGRKYVAYVAMWLMELAVLASCENLLARSIAPTSFPLLTSSPPFTAILTLQMRTKLIISSLRAMVDRVPSLLMSLNMFLPLR